jgi:uncharacterized surface protein with fasciclin (FAS1) repeats
MKYNYTYFLLAVLMISGIFVSCKKSWDNHDAVTDAQVTKNLMDQISQNPDLSTFSGYLVKTGFDKIISSSKTFTVWAPTNTAMQSVDATILNDSTKLKQFVGNHISNQSYLTNIPQPSLRIQTLNGKFATFTATTFEEANITQANQYVGNGILHVIDKAIIPKLNIWEYVNSLTTVGLKQKAYLQALNYSYTDTSQAIQTGVNPTTGKPILQPGTGVVNANTYLRTVLNVSDETKQYTYIVLTDAAFDNERNKVVKYFTTTGSYATTGLDSTTYLSSRNVVKDLAFNTLITPALLTDTLLSVNNVKVPFNKSAIVATYNASNGIVYVMNSVNFRLVDKITPILIQGESPAGFATTDKRGNIQYRVRKDPGGNVFNDILVAGGSIGTLPAAYYARYSVPNAYAAQYKVYWRALNDTGTIFPQQLAFGTVTSATFPYTNVNLNVYDDIYLGTYTVSKYSNFNMFMLGANVTTAGLNSFTLDYVKLVPVIQ